MGLFKEDVFPELAEPAASLTRAAAPAASLAFSAARFSLNRALSAVFSEARRAAFPEEALRQRVVSLAEGQGSLLEDEPGTFG